MAISDMAMRQRGHLSIKACALIVSCGFGCGSFSGCMEYSAKVQMPKSVFNERLPIITSPFINVGYAEWCLYLESCALLES
jgi:hypothetical protein